MRPMKKIPLLLTSLSALAAPWIQAKVPVFLTPDEKAALFMEVDSSKLMLPKDASNPTKASEGWKQAKYAVEQLGFTEKKNVLKELSLKPGSKIYSKAEAGSSLLAITNGQESVQILEPGEWTKVVLSKPITVYFTQESYAANLSESPALPPPPPIPTIEEKKEEEPTTVSLPEPATPVEQPKAPEPIIVKAEPEPEPTPEVPAVVIPAAPEPVIPKEPKVTIRREISAAAAPSRTISEFDNLENLDPNEVRRTVGPMPNALLEEIQELDPLEVRESAPTPLNPQQLPLEIKPTVSISRDFTGKLVYKKEFKFLPGSNDSKDKSPWQLMDENDKRIAYVRVDDIKVGNILNYANQHVILSGPLEENAKGDTPIIQGRTLRLNMSVKQTKDSQEK
jgi:hypothetical protein